jgi:hypothetical protein
VKKNIFKIVPIVLTLALLAVCVSAWSATPVLGPVYARIGATDVVAYTFMKADANGFIVPATAVTDRPFGVAETAGVAADANLRIVAVAVAGYTSIIMDGNVANGQYVMPDGNSLGMKVATADANFTGKGWGMVVDPNGRRDIPSGSTVQIMLLSPK